MVNEIHISLFIFLLAVDFLLIVLAFVGTKLPNYVAVISAVLATILSFTLSHSILNGTVVMISSTDTYIKVQSLPVFYFLEGLSVLLVVYTAFLIYQTLHEALTTHSALGSPEGWK